MTRQLTVARAEYGAVEEAFSLYDDAAKKGEAKDGMFLIIRADTAVREALHAFMELDC